MTTSTFVKCTPIDSYTYIKKKTYLKRLTHTASKMRKKQFSVQSLIIIIIFTVEHPQATIVRSRTTILMCTLHSARCLYIFIFLLDLFDFFYLNFFFLFSSNIKLNQFPTFKLFRWYFFSSSSAQRCVVCTKDETINVYIYKHIRISFIGVLRCIRIGVQRQSSNVLCKWKFSVLFRFEHSMYSLSVAI